MTASAARWVLAAELLLGGQARLTDKLTPQVHERTMQKAGGYFKYLNFLPVGNAGQHTVVIGSLMCTACGLLSLPSTRFRLPGAGLSMSLSVAGIYSQYRMGISYWVPCVNTALAAYIIYANTRDET